MWERVDDDDDEVLSWGSGPGVSEDYTPPDDKGAFPAAAHIAGGCSQIPFQDNKNLGFCKTLSVHSKEGRAARAILRNLSISELRCRLSAATGDENPALTDRESLAERLLNVQGVEAVLVGASGCPKSASSEESTHANAKPVGAPIKPQGLDYSRFNKIDFAKEYGLEEEEKSCRSQIPDLHGTPLEGLEPFRVLAGDLTDEERRAAFEKVMKDLEQKGGLKPPPAPPAPVCNPVAECAPPCEPDVCPTSWLEPYDAWPESADDDDIGEDYSSRAIHDDDAEVVSIQSDHVADPLTGADESSKDSTLEGSDKDVPTHDCGDGFLEEVSNEQRCKQEARTRVSECYIVEKQKQDDRAHVLEAVDVDGWALDTPQFDLVEDAEEDLAELRILLGCCERDDNRVLLQKAICEFEVKARVKRTWAWFPLTRWEWSGFEYEKPIIRLDYKVPGAGHLPPEDIHCEFGADWFDLKIWNIEYLEDPGIKYHHRVKKTRLMRDIVPSESFVKAMGDHVYVYLQKVNEPRHGYCAWPDLAAGKGRKPFKYDEDAPDGGLMDFFEGEYEKHEGYDGFRRDIGKAMEKIHRGEPIRGIDDSPIAEL